MTNQLEGVSHRAGCRLGSGAIASDLVVIDSMMVAGRGLVGWYPIRSLPSLGGGPRVGL